MRSNKERFSTEADTCGRLEMAVFYCKKNRLATNHVVNLRCLEKGKGQSPGPSSGRVKNDGDG